MERQLGTTSYDYGYRATVDAGGNIYVAGSTQGSFDGNTNEGYDDMFLVKYNTNDVKQ